MKISTGRILMISSVSPALSHKFSWAALLSSLLVVFIHAGVPSPGDATAWWTFQFMTEGLCRCAAPFFFLASGFFLALRSDEDSWWRTAVKKRLRTILLPFFLWNGLTLVLTRSFSAAEIIAGLGFNPMTWTALSPLWFLRSLMLFVLCSALVFPVLRRAKGGWGWALVGALVLGWFFVPIFFAAGSRWETLFKVTFSLEGFLFFVFGALLAMRGASRIPTDVNGLAVLIGLMICVFFRYLTLTVGGTGICGLQILIVVGGLIALWNACPTCPLPRGLTGMAFPIYLLHGVVFGVARAAGMALQVEGGGGLWIRWAACLAICWIVIPLGRKFFPKLCTILFGGRCS